MSMCLTNYKAVTYRKTAVHVTTARTAYLTNKNVFFNIYLKRKTCNGGAVHGVAKSQFLFNWGVRTVADRLWYICFLGLLASVTGGS